MSSSSTTYRAGDDDTQPQQRVAPLVRGRAPVRPLHSVSNDQADLPEPRKRDDARHTGSPTVLWASLLAAGFFVLALVAGGILFLAADEMAERVRVVGWVVVLCAFLITLTCAAVAVLVHDRRKDRANQHDEFFAFVEQATVAATARYQRILDGQQEIKALMRDYGCRLDAVEAAVGDLDDAERIITAATVAATGGMRPLRSVSGAPSPRRRQ